MNKLHTHLLVELRTVGKYGEKVVYILTALRPSFRELSEPELLRALRDLSDKSFVTPFEGALGGQRWRITSLGESALNEEGL